MRFRAVKVLAALLTVFCLSLLAGCGGSSVQPPVVSQIVLNPTMMSLNQGGVGTLSAVAEDAGGNIIAADITFSSSNSKVATISSGGLVCAGVWDSSIINCNATSGAAGVGTVTITATSGNTTATMTVYVHLQVDRVVVDSPVSGCTTMGVAVNPTASAYNTSASGCSQASPCDITSTVGPIAFGSNDGTIVGNSAGIESTYSAATNSPTYFSGGTITGTKDQTCNLSDFNGVIGATATVNLTGTNTIASGTQLTITNSGYGASVPPTSATLSDGTATCSGTAAVVTALNGTGVLTAENPGQTQIFASVSGVHSVGQSYTTCPVSSIYVRGSGGSNTSFTMTGGGTQPLVADVVDSNGQTIKPNLSWGSSIPAVATVAPPTTPDNSATLTAVTPGTASITASCSSPTCNKNLPAQYGENVVTANVTGDSSTTVFAASTKSLSLIPIPTSTNTPGTAITLPYVPNSIAGDQAGTGVFLGSNSGLMVVTLSSGTVTTFAINGTIVAVSPNGQYMLLSDSATNNVYAVNLINQTLTSSTASYTTAAAAYTPDSGFYNWLNGMQLAFGFQASSPGFLDLGYTTNAFDFIAQGGLTYITSSSGHQIDVRSTCNASEVQTLTANAPTLVKGLPNGTGAVAADSPSIDVVSTPSTLSAGCPVTTDTSKLNSYDLGAGSFNATQLFLSTDSSRAWIVSDLPDLLTFNLTSLAPTAISLAGGATPLSGGIQPDGKQVYVGASDGAVHRIDAGSLTDAAQIPVALKDSSGNPVTPNLVYVVP